MTTTTMLRDWLANPSRGERLCLAVKEVEEIASAIAAYEVMTRSDGEAIKAAYNEGYGDGFDDGQSISGNAGGTWETSKARAALTQSSVQPD